MAVIIEYSTTEQVCSVLLHRSAIVNIDRIKELEPWFHGEYVVIMRDGTRLTASRVFSDRLSTAIA